MKSFLLILFLASSHTLASAQQLILQGHQGARGIMPENTIRGMIKALELGVTTLDMDAVISADQQVVLSHEPYFNHEISLTPDGKSIAFKDEKKYNIFKLNYAEVKKFDVGSKIHPRFPGQQKYKAYKPLLSETIDSVEAYVKKAKLPKPDYNIETSLIRKGDGEFQPEPSVYVDLIMDVVKKKKLAKRVIIQSLDIRTLQYLHEKYPEVRTSLMVDEQVNFDDNIKLLGFTPTIYSPYSVLVGKGLVDRCHESGVKVVPWTVNSVKEIKYLLTLGVDGVVTDYPNLLKLAIGN
ncbi:MAG: glycerophosphodiester phosphodiesterase [Pedobacter sp.]|nr:MAG: glycerophosphodiester phosphodiesterase [Pedobacter sp.]